MTFVKIGKRIVNLDLVQAVYYDAQGGLNYDSPCVVIEFGAEPANHLNVFEKYEPAAFSQLMTWMDEQPALHERCNHE